MALKNHLQTDLAAFFCTDDFAVAVDFVTAGVPSVPAQIEFGDDPLIQQPNAATRATVHFAKSYVASVAVGDVVRFSGKDWIVEPPIRQGDLVTVLTVRTKEGVAY